MTHRLTAAVALGVLSFALAGEARAQCTSDADCRGGRVCRDGACESLPCTKDVDCPDHMICEAAGCVLAPAAPPALPVTPAPPQEPPPPDPYQAEQPYRGYDSDYEPRYRRSEPRYRRYDAPPPADLPVGYRTESRGIRWMYIVGPSIFAGSYLLTILYGGMSTGLTGYASIPLAGPWILAFGRPNDGSTPLFVVAGITQAAGVTLTILGLTVRREVRVPVYGYDDLDAGLRLDSIAPAVTADGSLGLFATGRF